MNGLLLKEENRNARTFISIVYSTSVPTSQTTQSLSIIKTNRLMLFRGVIGTFMRNIRNTHTHTHTHTHIYIYIYIYVQGY